MTRAEIEEGVRACVAAALDRPAQSVTLEARLIDDLGGDSLDLLDITFQLEQRFKISLNVRTFERRAKEALGGTPLEIDGVYTPEALVELRRALPEIPPEELAEGLEVATLVRRFRVATLVNLVTRVLEEHNG